MPHDLSPLKRQVLGFVVAIAGVAGVTACGTFSDLSLSPRAASAQPAQVTTTVTMPGEASPALSQQHAAAPITQTRAYQTSERIGRIVDQAGNAAEVVGALPTPASPYAQAIGRFSESYVYELEAQNAQLRAKSAAGESVNTWQLALSHVFAIAAGVGGVFGLQRRRAQAQ